MVKCGACGKFLSALGAASCSKCPGLYHKACVGLAEHTLPPKQWKCPECTAKRPKVGNINTPVKCAEISFTQGETSIVASEITTSETNTDPNALNVTGFASDSTQSLELSLEIRVFREEIQQLRKELKDFRAELCDMRGAIAVCNQRVDDITGRLSNLEKEVNVSTSLKCMEVEKLEETISQLKEDLNDRDQELIQSDIEITNLPEICGENPFHTVVVIAAKLGIDLDEKDVIFAERVGKKNEFNSQAGATSRGRRLVVRLSRRNLRDDLLSSARTRRGATTEGLGIDSPPRRFYVNERLTRKNKQLFYLTRETAKYMQWRYTWTKRGKIYVRQGDGKSAQQIKSEKDIERIFGDIKVGAKQN